jgi:hypothetical protein
MRPQASRAAKATMSAQETVLRHRRSSTRFARLMTLNPRRLGLLACDAFSTVLALLPGAASSSTDASQPCRVSARYIKLGELVA